MRATVILVLDEDNQEWLSECVESLQQQTMLDYELLICLNMTAGRPDMSVLPQDPSGKSVRVFDYGEVRSIPQCLHEMIQAATTDIMIPVEPEDIQSKHKFEFLTSVLEKNQDKLAATGTEVLVINARSELSDGWIWIAHTPTKTRNFCEQGKASVLHAGCAFRKSVYNEVGGYKMDLTAAYDMNLWAKMVVAGHLVLGIEGKDTRYTRWRKVKCKPTMRVRKVFMEERRAHRDHFRPLFEEWKGFRVMQETADGG